MSALNYYEVLNVETTATQDEIKSSYKQLAKKYHPDLNKEEGAADQFKKVNEAYEVIGDAQKRASYDASYQTYGAYTNPNQQQRQYRSYTGFGSETFKTFSFRELKWYYKILIVIGIIASAVFILLFFIIQFIISTIGKLIKGE